MKEEVLDDNELFPDSDDTQLIENCQILLDIGAFHNIDGELKYTLSLLNDSTVLLMERSVSI